MQILMNLIWDIFLFSLSLSSLNVIYPRERSVRIKTQKRFFLVFLLALEAILLVYVRSC
jgi:hypothetical protein